MTGHIIGIYEEGEIEKRNTELYSLTTKNNACVLIYNSSSGTSRAYDALGEEGCLIYSQQTVNPVVKEQIENDREDEEYIFQPDNQYSARESLIYSIRKKYGNETVYFISNFAVQSISALTKMTSSLFIYIAMIVMLLSLLISYFLSRNISKPIITLKDETVKLSEGDYDVVFNRSDIREVDELADNLNMMAKELGNIEETRKELFANVSHDLRTPLTMIKAYAEMIRDISGDNKKKRDEHLQVILNETDQLNYLVTDMLDLSKAQSFASDLVIEPYDFSSAIADDIEKFQVIAQQENITIKKEIEPELVALADKKRIDEVLYNFITNALKHTGDDKLVIIKAFYLDNKTIRVEIIDHGIGIAQEEISLIWDRYYKSDRQYKRASRGTGLGLAINKAILDEHHFNYGVNSQKGQGSMFYFEMKSPNTD